jgi:hypothetical protein
MSLAVTTATALLPVRRHTGTPSVAGTPKQVIDAPHQLLIQPFVHLALHGRLGLVEGCREHLATVDFATFWL